MQEKQDLFGHVNRPENPNAMTDLEKRHFPVITAPDSIKAGELFEVTIEVGKLMEHPNESGHFIQFIELYAADIYLARQDFTPRTTCPVMKVTVSMEQLLGWLRAYAHCNLHGFWEATKLLVMGA
jgi:superoxide reductase